MLYIFYGLIVFCCGYIGKSISRSFQIKNIIFDDFIEFIDTLKLYIGFFQINISSIISKCDKKFSKEFNNILDSYLKFLDSNDAKESSNYFSIDFLSNEEKGHIVKFFNSIGNSDVDNQMAVLEKYTKLFASYSTKYKLQYEKYGKLSVKLSIVIGILFVILLI